MEIPEIDASKSEPNLLRQSLYDLPSNSYRLIVDDLHLFRKKLPSNELRPKNNLKIPIDSYKDTLSEYMYCYGTYGGRRPNLDAVRPKYVMRPSHSFSTLKDFKNTTKNNNNNHFDDVFKDSSQSFMKITSNVNLLSPNENSSSFEEFNDLQKYGKIKTYNGGKSYKALGTSGSSIDDDSDIVSLKNESPQHSNKSISSNSEDEIINNINPSKKIIKFDRNSSSPITFRFNERILIKNRLDSSDVYTVNWSHSIRFNGNGDTNSDDVNNVKAVQPKILANKPSKGILKNNQTLSPNHGNIYQSKSVIDIVDTDSDNDDSGGGDGDGNYNDEHEENFFKNRYEREPDYRKAVTHFIQKENIDRMYKPLKDI